MIDLIQIKILADVIDNWFKTNYEFQVQFDTNWFNTSYEILVFISISDKL